MGCSWKDGHQANGTEDQHVCLGSAKKGLKFICVGQRFIEWNYPEADIGKRKDWTLSVLTDPLAQIKSTNCY